MDCNKDEALRAKSLAESKMQNRDFLAARKIVLKTKQLFPDLEKISQMLAVCEVHISAATKLDGESDWYSILQVETEADEQVIKRKYRKLALLLHPDKNNFAGAESAFKLIKEAYMVLSDKGKRSLFDMKRDANARQHPLQATRKQSKVFVNETTSGMHFNSLSQQQQPPSAFSNSQTFWTLCPNCNMKYQYYMNILHKYITCHSCLHPYVAHDMKAQPRKTGTGVSHNPSRPHHLFAGQNVATGAQQKFSAATAAGSNTGFQGKIGREPPVGEPSGINFGGLGSKKKAPVKLRKEGGDTRYEESGPEDIRKRQKVKSQASNGRRKRAKTEDDESIIDSGASCSSDCEDSILKKFNPEEPSSFSNGNCKPRRSSRQKQNISYNEDKSIDENCDDKMSKHCTSEKSSMNCISGHDDQRDRSGGVANGGNAWPWKSTKVEDEKNIEHEEHPPERNLPSGNVADAEKLHDMEQKGMAEEYKNSTSRPSSNIVEYPDPEFYDFDQHRKAQNFAADQIWALYDSLGEMPRYYARIRSVNSPEFRVLYTWLEYVPPGKAEIGWYKGGLPVACGKYKLGKSDYSRDPLTFSHNMAWKAGSKKNIYEIYPRKGEVWALFKNWDIGWSSNEHERYNYEVVEVLSDLTEGSDIMVIQLLKLEGFVGLFARAGKEASPLRIPLTEVLRFSHMVPSYKLKGNEREGVPGGCFELDAMSLPKNYGETFPSISLDRTTMFFEGTSSKVATCRGNLGANGTEKVEWKVKQNCGEEEKVGIRDPSTDQENLVRGKEYIEISSDLSAASEANTCIEDGSVACKANLDTSESDDGSESETYDFDYPEPEFHDFSEERSLLNFEGGQIWALYSDMDKYPNFYGLIKEIRSKDFGIRLVWLEACPAEEGETEWIKKGLPCSCGRFKVTQESQNFESIASFSHLVSSTPSVRKYRHDIYPLEGEVWAIFKEWNMQWTRTDLEKCEYELVEIVKRTPSSIMFSTLARLDGYKTVFMPDRKCGNFGVLEVPMIEHLRFSHRVPAFRLTDEKKGKLDGFWELDPASIPEALLFND